jgi:large subunit ribosomal protein L30
MGQLKITQVKSTIDRPNNQKLIIQALGLGRIRKVVIHDSNPCIIGMIKKVNHLITVEKIQA